MEATVAAANAKPLVKVAALCGSVRRGSYNRGLIRSAIEMSKGPINGLEIEDVDITGLPMLNTDLEGEGSFPPVVEAFRQKIREADSVLFASPEYNYSVSDFWTRQWSLITWMLQARPEILGDYVHYIKWNK